MVTYTAAIKQVEENLQQFLRGKLITIFGLYSHSHTVWYAEAGVCYRMHSEIFSLISEPAWLSFLHFVALK